jgi:hypothetical protein
MDVPVQKESGKAEKRHQAEVALVACTGLDRFHAATIVLGQPGLR